MKIRLTSYDRENTYPGSPLAVQDIVEMELDLSSTVRKRSARRKLMTRLGQYADAILDGEYGVDQLTIERE